MNSAPNSPNSPNYRYPTKTLIGDYLRGGGGLALSGGILVGAGAVSVVQYLMAALALLFAGFLLRTWQRHRTSYEVSDEGVRANGPFGAAIRWADVTDVRLKFFATSRRRTEGWFQLTIRGMGRKLSVDSELDGFADFLEASAAAIIANKLDPSPTTVENFTASGFRVKPADPDSDDGDGGDGGDNKDGGART